MEGDWRTLHRREDGYLKLDNVVVADLSACVCKYSCEHEYDYMGDNCLGFFGLIAACTQRPGPSLLYRSPTYS